MIRVTAYHDNEGEVRIAINTPQPELEAAMRQFERHQQGGMLLDEQKAADLGLADRLIGLDALWAATPVEPLTGIDGTWGRATSSSDPRAIIAEMGEEMDLLRRELAAERRRATAFQSRLVQVAGQKSVPGGWLWWPALVLAGVGIVDMARFVAELLGWR